MGGTNYEVRSTNCEARITGLDLIKFEAGYVVVDRDQEFLILVIIKKNHVMQDLKSRFFKFAVDTGELLQGLEFNQINKAYSNQLIRSSSSTGANYRAALRGKSTADFINKLKIVEEELDESTYFLDLIRHFNPKKKERIIELTKECNELLAIIVASIKTSRRK